MGTFDASRINKGKSHLICLKLKKNNALKFFFEVSRRSLRFEGDAWDAAHCKDHLVVKACWNDLKLIKFVFGIQAHCERHSSSG